MDSPSAMPVDLPEERSDDEAAETDPPQIPLFPEDLATDGSLKSWQLVGEPKQFDIGSQVATSSYGADHLALDKQVKFVDKGSEKESIASGKYEQLSAAAPPTVVGEALSLTTKKAVLFPWAKGRLGRLFGDQGRLALKQPRLNPSVQVSTILFR